MTNSSIISAFVAFRSDSSKMHSAIAEVLKSVQFKNTEKNQMEVIKAAFIRSAKISTHVEIPSIYLATAKAMISAETIRLFQNAA